MIKMENQCKFDIRDAATTNKFLDSVFKKEHFTAAEEFRYLFGDLLLSYDDCLLEKKPDNLGLFSSILKVKCGDKYYICNRHDSTFFSSLKQVPYYIKWWGYYGHEIFSFIFENITILGVLHGISNREHKHQHLLNIVKDTFKTRHPELEVNESICTMELNHAKKSITDRLRNTYRKWNSVYNSMNVRLYSNYEQKLYDGFINTPYLYEYYQTKHYRHECMSFPTFVKSAFGVTDIYSASYYDRLYFERMYAILLIDYYHPLTEDELKKHFDKI